MRITPEPEFSDYHLPYQACVKALQIEEIDRSIIDRFLDIVRSQPDAVAIESDTEVLSYGELNEVANCVAARIIAGATEINSPIALVFENTTYLIAAIFGVLKSGHSYLVLDPEYPIERLGLMLSDSCSQHIIAQGGGIEVSNQLNQKEIRCSVFEEILASSESGTVSVSIKPDALALIMYTSGSTGVPQGVVHTHRSLLAEVYNITTSWKVGSKDKFLLLASCAFASSIRTIFGALLNGGTVVPYNIKKYGFNGLGRCIEEHGITVLRSLPTTFRHYLNTIEDNRKFGKVRLVSLGGETVSPTDVHLFNRYFCEHAVLVLSFGPTECLTACWGFVEYGVEPEQQRVPMGFERRFKSILLVDESGKEVSKGASGELTVTSNYLAEGYWNNPAATNARFINNSDGSKTFYSGDIAIQNADGSFTHLGRKDFQIKVRGYRVDVFEIENVIRNYPGIRDAVVIGQDDEREEKQIVGFIMTEPNCDIPETSQLQEFLGKQLPRYMIPAMFKTLKTFPLNANGKLDRRAFPRIEYSYEKKSSPEIVETSSSIEVLRSLWAEALEIEQVPLDKNFMSLGGDSIKAIEVAFKIKERLGLDLSPTHILEKNDISKLAAYIESNLI